MKYYSMYNCKILNQVFMRYKNLGLSLINVNLKLVLSFVFKSNDFKK